MVLGKTERPWRLRGPSKACSPIHITETVREFYSRILLIMRYLKVCYIDKAVRASTEAIAQEGLPIRRYLVLSVLVN